MFSRVIASRSPVSVEGGLKQSSSLDRRGQGEGDSAQRSRTHYAILVLGGLAKENG